jgi:hypothetical protein
MIVTPSSSTHKVSHRVQFALSELESLAITPKRQKVRVIHLS